VSAGGEIASMDEPPCHHGPRELWCDRDGPGGFMGHTCYPRALAAATAALVKCEGQYASYRESAAASIGANLDEQLIAENSKLRAALEPFRHTRVRTDGNFAAEDTEILDMIDGRECVVGYARNGDIANEWNERFERVRSVLK